MKYKANTDLMTEDKNSTLKNKILRMNLNVPTSTLQIIRNKMKNLLEFKTIEVLHFDKT